MTSPMYWSTQHWLLCVSKLKYSSWMLFKHYISIDLISLFGSKPIPVLSNLHVARCGPWRHSVWPAKAHKNFRQWGPVQCPFFVSFRNAHTGWWRGCATTGDTHAVCSTALLCAASKMTLLNPFQQIFGWDINVRDFPELSKLCKKVLTMFGSTYVCQAGFSAMTNIKSQKRNSLT